MTEVFTGASSLDQQMPGGGDQAIEVLTDIPGISRVKRSKVSQDAANDIDTNLIPTRTATGAEPPALRL
jgi:hypothetical protein